MRRGFYSSGSQNDSIGCGIFILMIIFMPVLGFFTNIITFILDNKIIIIGVVIFFLLTYISFKDLQKEYEIEETED